MVGGRTAPEPSDAAHVHIHLMNDQTEMERQCCAETRMALERLWEAENPRTTRGKIPMERMTASEQAAEQIFEKTQQQRADGRYEVGLLWRPHVFLPSNFTEALNMFYQLERRMNQCPEMREKFINTIAEWKNKGIVEYLSPSDSRVKYILPTFMVVRLDKASTSYRLVVDGARRFGGTCINDKLWTGPKLIHNLQDIMVRFRQGSHAFTCDISMMYLNIRVPEKDRGYLCIFFRENPGRPLRIAQLQSHPFGLSSSPIRGHEGCPTFCTVPSGTISPSERCRVP